MMRDANRRSGYGWRETRFGPCPADALAQSTETARNCQRRARNCGVGKGGEKLPFTSRSDAREFKCPACEAESGEKCFGARGGRRESVHRERIVLAAEQLGHPPIRTLHLDGNRLVDPEGGVFGVLVGAEFDVQWEGDGGNLRRGEGVGNVVDFPNSSPKNQRGGGVGEDAQVALLPDPVVEVWDHYTKTLDRPKAQLTPKVRKWVADAIKSVGVDQCKLAIDGLAASEYHRTNGYVGIEYALRPKQNQTIESRVAFMASKAGPATSEVTTVSELLRSVPSDRHEIIRHHVEKVYAMQRSDREHIQNIGRDALSWLREHPPFIEPVFDGIKLRGWRKLR